MSSSAKYTLPYNIYMVEKPTDVFFFFAKVSSADGQMDRPAYRHRMTYLKTKGAKSNFIIAIGGLSGVTS